jgi:hypothetical protein
MLQAKWITLPGAALFPDVLCNGGGKARLQN